MISINKQGNAIVIEFTDNDKYLFNGTIEVAPNELMIVIDESNMATFKRSNNGDTLFSQLINKIQIGGNPVTKDTILDEFAKIGFQSIDWAEITGKPTTFSDWDATEGEQVIANKPDLSQYATNVELNHVKSELATKADTSSLNDYALKSEITGLATKEELADYQPIGDYATTTQLNSKQDTLVSGTNIKTINGQSVIGEGNIDITEGGTIDSELSTDSVNPVQNKVITNALNDKASKTELSNVSTSKADKADVYTKQEVDNKLATKQATLIQGTNITLSEPDSEGKVTISASQPDGLATKTEVTEGLATKLDTSVYNSEKSDFALKSEIPDTSGLATKEEISDMETKTSAAATYQPKGNYAGQQEVTDLTANVTALQADKQDTLVSGTNIKTINGQSLLGEGNIEIQQSELPIASADTLGGVKVGTGLSINPESGVLSADAPEWNNISGKPEDIVNITERLASKLDTATYNSEKSSFATKDELNSKADASAIADMATQTWVQGQGYLTEVPSDYVTNSELTEGLAGKQDKGNYALKSDLNTLATKEELATKADASALSSKQDTLVSGTNIKTINGETILGAGDITIQAGGTVDTAMSDTSENAVQNKVIKAYIDDLVGNILTQLQEINGTN